MIWRWICCATGNCTKYEGRFEGSRMTVCNQFQFRWSKSTLILSGGEFCFCSVCLVRAGLTWTKVTNTNRSTAVDWSCKSTNDKQIGHSSQPLNRSMLCEVCWSVQQLTTSPMSWDNKLHGLSLWFWCWLTCAGHSSSVLLRGRCLPSCLRRPALTRAKLDVCSGACTAAETLEWIGNSRFAKSWIAIDFVQGRASPCVYRHLEKQLRDDFVPLGYIVNARCFFVKLQEFWVVTSRGILGPPGNHDCVQSIQVLGRIVERTADGITWEADPRHAERFRSTKKRQIGIVRTRCVHSISLVTDLMYRSSAVIWHARCNSSRTWMKWDWRDWLVFSECVRGWFGCSSGRSVLHESNPGVVQTMQAVSELGRVLLVVRWCWVSAPSARIAKDWPWLHSALAKRSVMGWWVRHRKCLACRAFSLTRDGSSMPMCGWTPQLEFRLGAGEGSDEWNTSTQCSSWCKRWSLKARSHSARSLPKRCLQTFSRNTSTLQRCKVAWLDWDWDSSQARAS